ncbi:MAG TPA: ABC transporter permease [Dehalococcoidia bacterium]|nr:ABC transporter permease [Dehalococcoidia bacterium]
MRKFVTDALVIWQMQAMKTRRWLPVYVFSIVLVPIGTLLFAKALIPEGMVTPEVETRLVTGSLVFGIGIMTVNNLAQIFLWERFGGMLRLIITAPVRPMAYASGIILYALTQGMFTAAVLLSFAPLLGIDVHLDLWLVPVLALTSLSLAGLGIVIATWSPRMEVGNLLANVAGIMAGLLSPIYYPIERLPAWLQWVVRASPYTHAGQAVGDILAGRGGFMQETLILFALTALGLTLGVAGLRWRER